MVGLVPAAEVPQLRPQNLAMNLFWIGALIYSASFALGHNWGYRLVFLILCLPWLRDASGTPGLRRWGWAALGALFVTMLAPFDLPLGMYLIWSTANWVLAGLLTVGTVGLLSNGATATTQLPNVVVC